MQGNRKTIHNGVTAVQALLNSSVVRRLGVNQLVLSRKEENQQDKAKARIPKRCTKSVQFLQQSPTGRTLELKICFPWQAPQWMSLQPPQDCYYPYPSSIFTDTVATWGEGNWWKKANRKVNVIYMQQLWMYQSMKNMLSSKCKTNATRDM